MVAPSLNIRLSSLDFVVEVVHTHGLRKMSQGKLTGSALGRTLFSGLDCRICAEIVPTGRFVAISLRHLKEWFLRQSDGGMAADKNALS